MLVLLAAFPTSLIYLAIVIVIIGVLLWLVNNFIPMEPRVKSILNGLVVFGLVIYILVWLLRFVD